MTPNVERSEFILYPSGKWIEEAKQYFKFIPRILLPSAYIAGSSVVDYAKATDVDIFVINAPVNPDERKALARFIESRVIETMGRPFTSHRAAFRNDSGAHNYLACSFTPQVAHDDDNDVFGSLLNDDQQRKPKVCQVILSTATSIDELLDNFDLSCCMMALNWAGGFHKAGDFTPPYTPIEVHNAFYNTPERYIKMCKRYNQPVEASTLDLIQQTIEHKGVAATQLVGTYGA